MTGNTRQPYIDRLLDALSHQRRRLMLAHMQTSDRDDFHVDDLVEMIASQEREPPPTADNQRDRVKTTLHHQHLPKMDEAGLIEYDQRSGDVRYRGATNIDAIDLSRLLHYPEEPSRTLE